MTPLVIKIRDDSDGHFHKDDPFQNRGSHFNDEGDNHYEYGRKRQPLWL